MQTDSYLVEQSWDDVREQVNFLNPSLAQAIDTLSLTKNHVLYQVDYPFGFEIFQKGEFHFPHATNGSIGLAALPSTIQQQLDYLGAGMPLAMVLNRTLEEYYCLNGRIIPFSLIKAGELLGYKLFVSAENLYTPQEKLNCISAGARSIFFLPKITEHGAHQRLRKIFDVSADKPQNILQHWQIFRSLVNNPLSEEPWKLRLLIFGRQWLTFLKEGEVNALKLYLQQYHLEKTLFWRNEYLFRLLLLQLNRMQNMRINRYVLDTIYYLLQVSLGVLPGFDVALNEDSAPIHTIQKAYLEIYGLNYAPIMMQPAYFNYQHTQTPIYVSLQHNAALELNLRTTHKKTYFTELCEVAALFDKYIHLFTDRKLELHLPIIDELIKNVRFKYFHSHTDDYSQIRSTETLPATDPRFLSQYSDLPFPYKSHFLNGCIQLLRR
ncbi:MAG: hypothetical protein KIT27_08805 [Legionellales bacterium]|nr:hypothetical protein [Legionellales bacterium]